MRVEVLVGNEDAVVYPLSSAKVTVGSSDNCDIILTTEGVSRKHLTILNEGENFFVIDQGSTSGSYINEERLIPGKKTEFTSFFPVRLGEHVLISLLSDEESSEDTKIEVPSAFKEEKSALKSPSATSENQTASRVPSLRDLEKAKTDKIFPSQGQRSSGANKKKAAAGVPVKKKRELNFVPIIAIVIFIGAAFFNYTMLKNEETTPPPAEVAQVGKLIVQKPVEPPKPKEDLLVPKEDRIPKENYARILSDIKCTTDIEISLCDYFPGARQPGFGVIQYGLTMNVLLDGTELYKEAAQFVDAPTPQMTPEQKGMVEDLINKTVAYIFFLRLSSGPVFEAEKFKDSFISIALFRKVDETSENYQIGVVISIKPEALARIKEYIIPGLLNSLRMGGESTLAVTKDKYVAY
jgi:hypothetical protein